MHTKIRIFTGLVFMVSMLLLVGCSDTSGPADDDVIGDLDPGSGRVTLKTLELSSPEGMPVRLALEADGIELVDDGVTVKMNVVLRNTSGTSVGAPLIVWVTDFSPDFVATANHDYMAPGLPGGSTVTGFDYSDLLGEDGVLAPGESSEPRSWHFHDDGQGPFSFGGWLEGGFGPPPGALGGFCFMDVNLDGVFQPDEQPFAGLTTLVRGPDGVELMSFTGPDGRYSIPASAPGLYEIRLLPPPTFAPVDFVFTTPHPLFVTLTPGPEGSVQSYDDANFGLMMFNVFPTPPPVIWTDAPADSLHIAPWHLLDVSMEDRDIISLHVGYSGCGPEHPMTLYAVGGFMESMPPQLNLVLVNEINEDCDAYWTETPRFSLLPVFDSYREGYGPGELVLNLIQPGGDVTSLTVNVPGMPYD